MFIEKWMEENQWEVERNLNVKGNTTSAFLALQVFDLSNERLKFVLGLC